MTAIPARVEVAIVGGGPAGAVLGGLLARRGRDVVILERSPAWRWRACGVFSSPATVAVLRAIGVPGPAIDGTARAVPAMRVETPAGTRFAVTYGAESGGASAVAFDRERLDTMLLDWARAAGATVVMGTTVEGLSPRAGWTVRLRSDDGQTGLSARVVVGADGIRSIVARELGVARPARIGQRVGLTFHVPEGAFAAVGGQGPADARMVVLDDGYCGLAPVPDGRINVGIVLGGHWRARLHSDGAAAVARAIVARVGGPDGVEICDSIEGAVPLGHRVSHRAGRDWLLVGDAAGFLDPFTGEGLHRALVSARLAASAIDRRLRGQADALAGYERAMRARFAAKDVVSWLVQGFLGRPRLFEHAARRLATRRPVREELGLVMGDLVPARRGLDPRFLAALLAP